VKKSESGSGSDDDDDGGVDNEQTLCQAVGTSARAQNNRGKGKQTGTSANALWKKISKKKRHADESL